MKVYAVTLTPAYGQYLYIIVAKSKEDAKRMAKRATCPLYNDEDWDELPTEDTVAFCEIEELPLAWTEEAESLPVARILAEGGYQE